MGTKTGRREDGVEDSRGEVCLERNEPAGTKRHFDRVSDRVDVSLVQELKAKRGFRTGEGCVYGQQGVAGTRLALLV